MLKIYDIHCRYFQDYLDTKNIFLSWQAEYNDFGIPRWRYLPITLYRIFSCCVSCNGLSIGIIYLWNILEKKLYIYIYIIYVYRHHSLWKLKLKRAKQTEWVERTGQLPDRNYGADQADLTDYINGIVFCTIARVSVDSGMSKLVSSGLRARASSLSTRALVYQQIASQCYDRYKPRSMSLPLLSLDSVCKCALLLMLWSPKARFKIKQGGPPKKMNKYVLPSFLGSPLREI